MLFGATLVWGSLHHEPWRDEVVPLSIARQADSLSELVAPLGAEGHPILWYLVLWCAHHLVAQTWILKAASVGSSLGAVILLSRSPLAWWIQWLFAFSFFPLWQFGVVSRGYALEMLLLFAVCALYPSRGVRPLLFGAVLVALINSEVFGLIMAVAIGAMVVVDALMSGGNLRRLLANPRVLSAIALYLGGFALFAAVAFPDPGRRLSGFARLDAASVALGIGRAILQPAAHSTSFATVPLASLWIWAYFAYLIRKPPVLAFAAVALIGIETLFNLLYGPGAPWRVPWHIGNVVLVLVAAMWLDASDTVPSIALPRALERARVWLGRTLCVGVAVMFGGQIVRGARELEADLRYPYSANRAFAEFLRDPRLVGAVVMGEPDTPLWSVPYYADNHIFLARENAYRAWGIFADPRMATYDLDAFLAAARRVQQECGCPVVVTMGWPLDRAGSWANFRGTQFEERFDVTEEARERFLASTHAVGRLGPTISDESYDVYVLR